MDELQASDMFGALASQPRLAVLRLLMTAAPGALAAGDLSARLGIAQNTLSAHLSRLERGGLVRSERQGRSVLYRAQTGALSGLLGWLVQECCGNHPQLCLPSQKASPMTDTPLNILILCTGNSARSILAEALFNARGQGRVRAWSAGSHPSGAPNPFALQLLERNGHDVSGLRSKSWDEFAGPEAPQMDYIFTVCDSAAGETCPYWPGQPVSAHWGLPDPAAVEGSDAVKAAAFAKTYGQLTRRIDAFLALPLDRLEAGSLKEHLTRITLEADQ